MSLEIKFTSLQIERKLVCSFSKLMQLNTLIVYQFNSVAFLIGGGDKYGIVF